MSLEINIRCCCEPRFCMGSIVLPVRSDAKHVAIDKLPELPRYIQNENSLTTKANTPKVYKVATYVKRFIDTHYGTVDVVAAEKALVTNHEPQSYFEAMEGYQPFCLI